MGPLLQLIADLFAGRRQSKRAEVGESEHERFLRHFGKPPESLSSELPESPPRDSLRAAEASFGPPTSVPPPSSEIVELPTDWTNPQPDRAPDPPTGYPLFDRFGLRERHVIPLFAAFGGLIGFLVGLRQYGHESESCAGLLKGSIYCLGEMLFGVFILAPLVGLAGAILGGLVGLILFVRLKARERERVPRVFR